MIDDKWILIGVVVACFIAGYAIISFIFGMLKSSAPLPPPEGSINKPHDYSEEERHAAVLGLGHIYTADEVKSAFQKRIAGYRPDAASPPGEEAGKTAETKTREILEAYDFFRRTYNIK